MAKNRLKILPLGGLGEIGKNMLALEYGSDIMVIDAGLMFAGEELFGVDLVVPDITYLLQNREKVRGIVITHGHEDHIGALPYVLSRLNVPVYAARLAHGLIRVKLKEHKLLSSAQLHIFQPGDRIKLGCFEVEAFWVNHSIPDAQGLIIHTPLGTVVHSGDFKIDYTPIDGNPPDFTPLARLATEEVLLLFSDSTYVELPGHTPSERVVAEAIDRIIAQAPGRVIVTTFASLISRVQLVINAAAHHGRKVFIVGRSMVDNVRMATELGYLKAPPGVMGRPEELGKLPPEAIVMVTTGSQGEPTSALARIANGDHRQIHIQSGDTVVMSASPIPGNEELISRTIDNLFRLGADVIYSRLAQVHVHGHGSQEELKLLLSLVHPRFFIPVHGEYRHLVLHTKLAQSIGIPAENTFVLEDGQMLELTLQGGRITHRDLAASVYVDGLGTGGDIGQVVLRDRRALAQDGVVIVVVSIDRQRGRVVGSPDIISRGFVDERDSAELLEEARHVVVSAIDHGGEHALEWSLVNSNVRDALGRFLYQQTRRRPMILPVAVEV